MFFPPGPHLYSPSRGGQGGHAAVHPALLNGVDQLMGGDDGVKAAGAEIDVRTAGKGPGSHRVGPGCGVFPGMEPNVREVRLHTPAHFRLYRFGRTGRNRCGKPVGLLLRLWDLRLRTGLCVWLAGQNPLSQRLPASGIGSPVQREQRRIGNAGG